MAITETPPAVHPQAEPGLQEAPVLLIQLQDDLARSWRTAFRAGKRAEARHDADAFCPGHAAPTPLVSLASAQ